MSYAPDRVRPRAPWIAFLLIPLLALAAVVAPAGVATAVSGPSIEATVTDASETTGLTVRVTGTNFGDITGAYAALIIEGTEAAVTATEGYAAFGYWMTPGAITGGTFDKTLTATPDTLDPTQNYEVIVWQGHTTPTTDTIYARTPVTITTDTWNTIYPPALPDFGIAVDDSGLADGSVEVTGVFPTTYSATSGSTLTTGLYLMYCVAPAGEPGSGASGRAGGTGNCESTAQKWVVQPGIAATPGTTQIGTIEDGIWTFTTTVAVTSAFGTKTCLDAVTTDDGAEQCGIAVRLDHNSGSGANATYTFDQFVPVSFPEPAPGPSIEATVSDASETTGLTVRVTGTNFGDITGAYAALIIEGTEAAVTATDGYAAFGYWMTPGAITGGTFDKTLTATPDTLDPTQNYEVIVWQGHTTPTTDTIYARTPVTITTDTWNTIYPGEDPGTEEPGTEEPGTDEPGTPSTPTPAAGRLTWGVKASFRSYVTGPIAQGTITTSGVSNSSSGYVFPQAGDATLANGTGTVSYAGSVRFTGHGGQLDLRLSDPQVRIDSSSRGTLLVRVDGGSRIAFATLALSSGARTTGADGSLRYSGVPATLTSTGADAFSSFYSAGTALDPVSFVAGSAGSSLGGVVITAASSVSTTRTPATTPPATSGITLTGSPVPGGTVVIEAGGFEPNETGILVVAYSTPTVLDENATADSEGRVRWEGVLPAGLTGRHTLTLQGSVNRGVVIEIAEATALPCTVSDAEIVWGFKESFRAYIDGAIANGEWTTDGGASYDTPVFTWSGGTGGIDADELLLDVSFTGSVRFTGHDGALDTTVANPRIVADGERTVLLLDVFGTTQDGAEVAQTGVEFAELGLSDVEPARDGDTLTWTDVAATLTASGSAAFGTYPEGEALDPVTIVAPVEAGCATTAEPTPDVEAIDGEETDVEPTATAWPVWATVVAVLIGLLIIAAIVFLVLRRRRAA
ncbi:HtaA domain-containing protein [Homoserinibacter sp. GY 40078]|uniref:HtaA domain-containing protein n=1 Tax=Homoserinibacter sp. GY 40078 TaxID=2603275 RepID=UPI0011C903E8|nr:HtaA domain-containing protein [Homoserinibacter sp. GY 40078]TXK19344.1 hypothetical protein FVQ89_05380 [Homoserinibacter sp. GY 40078]